MNNSMTAPSVVEERLEVLRGYTVGFGLALPENRGPRPGLLDDEGRRALGVNSFGELRQVLQFARATESQRTQQDISAACHALNVQRDVTRSRVERQKAFAEERVPGCWESTMHRLLVAALEDRGLYRLALTFPELHQQLADTDDGK